MGEARQVDASLKYREESAIEGFGNGIEAAPFATSVDQEDTRLMLEHTYIAENQQNEVRFTYEDSVWSPNSLTSALGTTIETASAQRILRSGGVSATRTAKLTVGFDW